MHGVLDPILIELGHLANFHLQGKKTFFISEGLTERLAATELNVPAEFLRPPFPSCMFVYDDTVMKSAFFALCPKGGSLTMPVSVTVTLLGEVDCMRLLVLANQTDIRTKRQGAMTHRELSLRPGRSLEDALRSTHPVFDPETGQELTGPIIQKNDEQFFGVGLRMMRIIVNTLLYLSSRAPEISGDLWAVDRVPPLPAQSSPKAKRGRAGYLKSLSQHPYIEVGPSVARLERELPPEANSPSVRFLVRGHWRNQAHGKGRSLRRFQWIQPFWKGPEMAEIVSKPYRVDGLAPLPGEGSGS
jgi:hypothetical protein